MRRESGIRSSLTQRLFVAAAGVLLLAACDRGPTQATPESLAAGPDAMEIMLLGEGDGPVAEQGDTAVVHYTGWLFDAAGTDGKGEKFDSSLDRGQAFRFPLGAGRVIRGWDLGVEGMAVGERRRLIIPAELAYGDRGAGGVIPPGATLVFDLELLAVE